MFHIGFVYIYTSLRGCHTPCFGENILLFNIFFYFIILFYDLFFNICKKIIYENSLEIT